MYKIFPKFQETPSKRHKRSGTYDVDEPLSSASKMESEESPGVREMVESMKGEMSNEELKQTLLNQIDKRVKKKGLVAASSPPPTFFVLCFYFS